MNSSKVSVIMLSRLPALLWKHIGALALFIWLQHGAAFSQQQVLPRGVPAPALEAWKKSRTALTGITGRYRHTRRVALAGETKSSVDEVLEFGASDKGAYLREEKNGKTFVVAANPEGVFQVSQIGDGGKYTLDLYQSGAAAKRLRPRVRDKYEPFLFAGFEIAGKTMPDLVSSKHFVLRSFVVSSLSDSAAMEFEYAAPHASRDTALTGGIIRFSPQKNWMIESFECKTFWGRMDGNVSYRTFDGLFVPQVFTLRMFGEADNSVVSEVYELFELKKMPSGQEPIYLANYGLTVPTPKITPHPSESWRVWIVVANIALVVALLVSVRILSTFGREKPKGQKA